MLQFLQTDPFKTWSALDLAQEDFIKRMEVTIKRKNEKEVLVEEGWYTKDEMLQDLSWSETFI